MFEVSDRLPGNPQGLNVLLDTVPHAKELSQLSTRKNPKTVHSIRQKSFFSFSIFTWIKPEFLHADNEYSLSIRFRWPLLERASSSMPAFIGAICSFTRNPNRPVSFWNQVSYSGHSLAIPLSKKYILFQFPENVNGIISSVRALIYNFLPPGVMNIHLPLSADSVEMFSFTKCYIL